MTERSAEAHWRNNHAQVVATKRGTEMRLKVTLAALQQIYDMCGDVPEFAVIRQIAGDAFERATVNLPGLGRTLRGTRQKKTARGAAHKRGDNRIGK